MNAPDSGTGTGTGTGTGNDRLMSLDAYRGFVMLAMASGGLGVAAISQDFPDSFLWQALDRHLQHADWRGGSAWDMIQPSFMFLVGAAMPYSDANRKARGVSWPRRLAHAARRSLVLIALGVFLASAWGPRTNFTFTNVLAQIGLGSTFVFLLLGRSPRVQLAAALAILAADWLLFALYPLPSPVAQDSARQLPPAWNRLDGLATHWEKHTNVAAQADRWLLNRFPRPVGKPFTENEGGYTTLNFLPSIATMIFGALAGNGLRANRPAREKLQGLLIAAALAIVGGTALDALGCPIVKRIWTPSWALFSAGWACGALAIFYATIDVAGYRRWSFPLVVVGTNSIAAYLMAQLLRPFVLKSLRTHLGPNVFNIQSGGTDFSPMAESLAFVAVLWLICFWMYQQKLFVKI